MVTHQQTPETTTGPNPSPDTEGVEPAQDLAQESTTETPPKATPFVTGMMALEPRTLQEVESVATIFAKSGLFEDARSMYQAFVKIMAGREMGFGAFQSMTGIHIIKGKPTVGAGLMAAAVKRHDAYDYTILHLDNQKCELEFFECGKSRGRSTFTMDDARKTGQIKDGSGWEKFPRNMLFARALSNGQRWFCPDVFAQPVYTPEEMGAEVDEEGNMIITGEYVYRGEDPEQLSPGASKGGDRRINGGDKGKKVRPPDEDTPWQMYIANWGSEQWKDYWVYCQKPPNARHPGLGLTRDEVHEALEVESVKAFEGTRGAHNRRLLNASRVKRGMEPLDDADEDEAPAHRAPAVIEGNAKPKGAPFHMPTPKDEAAPEPDPDEVHSGIIARAVATAQPGSKPRLDLWLVDDKGQAQAEPLISADIRTSELRTIFGERVPKVLSTEGTELVKEIEILDDPVYIEWTVEEGEVVVQSIFTD